ncbi:uncharacterized protein LOC105687437 [Athalia rosae]|uniref:uncharacterized protein LOC105687437 n=1 Tax=Athalia rosae TaxID=37344 RepID=UPI0020334F3C|nr:uncharacterized protein LOC105687437 [Athalia rosae]
MTFRLIVFVALAIASSAHALPTRSASSGCSVSINEDLNEPQPLVLVAKNLGVGYRWPVDTTGTLKFAANEEFRLVCSGNGNYLMDVGDNKIQDIAAYCVSDKTFLVNSVEYEFADLVCKKTVPSVVRKTGKTCLNSYTQLEIGFDLGKDFLGTMDVCRDQNTFVTYYVKVNLPKSIGGFQSGYPRPSWSQSDFWGPYAIGDLYYRPVQKSTMSLILKSEDLGQTYISSTTNYYFARGHLAPKADFVYGSAQRSTFWYINAAPQWQTFNAGNWMFLESDVRKYASSSQLDLEIFTGVHGIATLPDEKSIRRELYFYATGKERALPIPKFFWKIVYDPISRKGTAFVGVNDVYVTELTDDRFICEDVSGKIPWLSWQPASIRKGISYACAIDDLRKVVPTLPKLDVAGILS